jgi:hypothetical protein
MIYLNGNKVLRIFLLFHIIPENSTLLSHVCHEMDKG